MRSLVAQPITREAFAPFGDIIDFGKGSDFAINNGMCDRFHYLAECEAVGEDAKTIISLGRARKYDVPLTLNMMERHPFGSQAFVPLEPYRLLVVVAPDDNGKPGEPVPFVTEPGQGVNYRRNVWHSVLTPFEKQSDFLIVDRHGVENNLEEYFFEEAFSVSI